MLALEIIQNTFFNEIEKLYPNPNALKLFERAGIITIESEEPE